MKSTASRLWVAALLTTCFGCSRACGPNKELGGDASEPSSLPEAGPVTFAPARCVPAADAITFDKLGVGEVAGDLLVVADRVVMTSIRSGVSSVGIGTPSLDRVDWTALGPAFGDAPPAVLAASADHAYALSWEKGDSSSGRALVVTMVRPSIERRWSTFEPDVSESLAVDAAFVGERGLVAWDTSRGIKVTTLGGVDVHPPRALSAEGALASAPRVVRRKSDWVVVWSERRLDTLADGAARLQPGEQIESPAERRSYEWLAFAIVGDDGEVRGAPRRITSETGHVGRFDVALADDDSIDVFANDEADAAAQSDVGGRVVKVSIRADRAEAPVEIASSGVGSGAPSVQRASKSSWLFFEDPLGRARALPITTPAALPSLEPALTDVRLETTISPDTWLGMSSSAVVRIRCGEVQDASSQTNGGGH